MPIILCCNPLAKQAFIGVWSLIPWAFVYIDIPVAAPEIPAIKELVSYDELELDTLGDEKTIISDTGASLSFLVSMAYTQGFNLLCEKADDVYGASCPYTCAA